MLFEPPPDDTEPYDEFALVVENAAEMGVAWPGPHLPSRHLFRTATGQQLGYVRWGDEPPERVYLHGGGQNAHTWDSVVVAAGRPAIAVDLPGHGYSDRRSDRDYSPETNAAAVAELIAAVAPDARAIVGMSLGGVSLIVLASRWPQLVRRAVIVDASPQVGAAGRAMTAEQRGSVALISGPPTYDSFEAVFEATMALSPTRTPAGIRRGVRHNTVRLPDGKWAWRYDLFRRVESEMQWRDFTHLWADVSAIDAPTMLVLGGDSVYVLPDDVDEYRRRIPTVRVESVPGSGHAVQSDQPAALVGLLAGFVDTDG